MSNGTLARRSWFITGTDTGIGKTHVACALLRAFAAQGHTTLGLKPVAAGCIETAEGLRNEDALALIAASTQKLSYSQVNPVALRAPLAPHIAARQEGKRITNAQLSGLVRGAMMQARAGVTLVEGAGGWRVPVSDRETLAGLAGDLKMPVILVVGMRLGCINHALLTADAILRDGLTLAGWVANTLDADMPALQENIDTLRSALPAPLLGVVPCGVESDAVFDLAVLSG